MNRKVSITFDIIDEEVFKAAYKKALKTSGYDAEEQVRKLADMDDETALIEIIADATAVSNFFEEAGINLFN
jgi:hypothetical protein